MEDRALLIGLIASSLAMLSVQNSQAFKEETFLHRQGQKSSTPRKTVSKNPWEMRIPAVGRKEPPQRVNPDNPVPTWEAKNVIKISMSL